MAGYVDEKVAKVTLDNKSFTKNTKDTISALEKLKAAFSKLNSGNASNNIAKEMNAIPDAVSKSTTKSQGLLSKLKGLFTRSLDGINMSKAGKSIDQMNTDIADKTSKTSSILARLKSVFKKADSPEGLNNMSKSVDKMNSSIESASNQTGGILSKLKGLFRKADYDEGFPGATKSLDNLSKKASGGMLERALSGIKNMFRKADYDEGFPAATKSLDNLSKKASGGHLADALSGIKNMFRKADYDEGFPAANKSLDNLSTKVSKFDAGPISNSFEKASASVQKSITAMDIAMGQLLANGIQKAVGFGKKFFAGPVDGLGEYKDKLGSIQTIMTNTEWAIPDPTVRMRKVSSTLEQLNDYADKTIYSFKDMTKNIGTFTAAGVGLDESATAIKGIGNLAAASGASTEDMSRAMYQLSQALASGRVGLMDWNSVVNANMGGKLFQDALTEMGKKMGHARDETKAFRDTLKDGWLTADVLIATLKDFSVDQSMLDAAQKIKSFGQLVDTVQESIGSGWATSWEYLFGGFEEAKSLWTSVGEITQKYFDDAQGTYFDSVLEIERSLGNYRNAMLKTWKDMGGQEALFDGIKNSFEGIFKAMTNFREGFREVIGTYDQSAYRLLRLTQGFRDFTASLKNNAAVHGLVISAGRLMGNIFMTVYAVLKRFHMGLKSTIGSFDGVILVFKRAADGISQFLSSIRSNFNVMSGIMNIGKAVGNVISTLGTIFKIAADLVFDFFKAFMPKGNGSGFKSFTEGLVDVTTKIRTFVEGLRGSIREIGLFSTAAKIISTVFENIKNAIQGLFHIKFDGGFLDGIFEGLKSFISNLTGISKPFAAIGNFLKGAFDNIINVVKKSYAVIKGIFKDLQLGDIIAAGLGLAALDKALQFKSGDGIIKKFLTGLMKPFKDFIKTGEEEMGKVSKIFNQLGETLNAFTNTVRAFTLITIAGALLILALAIARLSKIDIKDLSKGIIGMMVAFNALNKIMSNLSKLQGIPKSSVGTIIAVAIAIRILAGAMVELSKMNIDQAAAATLGLYALTKVFGSTLKMMEKIGKSKVGVFNMIAIAISLRILVSSVAKLAQYSPEQLVSSVLSVSTLLLALAGAMKIMDNVKINLRTSLGILTVVASLRLLVWSVKSIVALSPEQMISGITAVGSLLLELSLAMRILNNVKIKMGAIGGLITLTLSLRVLIGGVKQLADMDPESLIKGISALGALLTELVLAARALKDVKIKFTTIATLLTFVFSITTLLKALSFIKSMDPGQFMGAIGGMSFVLAGLIAAAWSLDGLKINLSTTAAVLAFAISMKMIGDELVKLAFIPWPALLASVLAMGAVMAGTVMAIRKLNQDKINTSTIVSLLAAAVLLQSVGSALSIVAKHNWQQILVAVGAIGATLGILVIAMKAVENVGLKGAGSILLLAVALNMLAIPIAVLSKLNLVGVGIGMLALAGNLAILLAAAAIAQFVAPGLALLASTMISFGVSSILASASIAIAGAGFLAFAMAVDTLAKSAPGAMAKVAKGFVEFITTIAQNAPKIVAAFVQLGHEFLKGLSILIPDFVKFGLKTVVGIINGIAEGMPQIFKAAVNLLMEFAKAFMENIDVIVQTGLQIAVKFIESLAKGLMQVKDRLIPALTELFKVITDIVLGLLGNLIGPILEKLAEILTPVKDFILGALSEFATAIEPIFTPLMDALKVLFESLAVIIRSLADAIIAIVQSIAQVVQALAPVFITLFQTIQVVANDIVVIFQTIGQTITNVANAIVAVVQTIGQTIQSVFQSIASIVNSVMQGIVGAINGFANVISAAGEAIKNVFVGIGQGIQAALQGVASVVQSIGGAIKAAFEGIGAAAQGVGQGIQSALQGVASIVESVGSAVKSALEGIGKAFEGAGKFAEGFGKGIKAVMDGVSNIVKSVGDAIKGIIEAIGHAFKDVGTGIERMGKGMKPIADHGFQAAAAITAVSGAVALLGGASYTGNLNGFRADLDKLDTVMYKMSTRKGSGDAIKDIASALKTASSAAPSAASALEKFASSSEKIKSSSSGMASNIKSVANALSSVGQSTMGAAPGIMVLAAGLEKVANTLSQFISRITAVGASMSSLGMMFTTTGSAVANLSTAFSSISNGTTAFGNAMNQARTALAQFGASAAGSTASFAVLGTAMTMAMTLVVNAVNNGMNQARAALQQGFALMGAAAATSMTTVVMAVNLGMMSVVNAIRTNMASVSTVISTGMAQAAAGMARGFAMMSVSAATSMALVRTTVMTGMMGVVQSIQNSMNQAATAMAASMSRIAQAISSSMSQINAQMNMSLNMMRASMQMAFMTMQMTIMTAMMQMANQIRSSSAMMHATMLQLGTQMVSAMRMAMALLNVTILTGMMQAANGVRSAAGVAHAGGVYVGSMISQGVAAGIRAHLGSVIAATNEIVAQAERAAKAKAKIKSPSRLFAANVGKYIPQGVAMGIVKEMPKSVKQMGKTFANGFSDVTSLAVDHASGMASAVADAVNTVGTLLDDSLADMDYRPTITPVVDTTNLDKLQNGNILRGIGVDATNVPRPAYSGVPSSMQSTNTNVYDNSNKEYSITVKVDNGGKPVDGKQLAREIQQHIKDFDDQARRGKGEEVLW